MAANCMRPSGCWACGCTLMLWAPPVRASARQWQKAADRDDAEPGGLAVAIGELNQALDELPRRLERLRKSGLKKLSRSDEDARFLRQRGGFVLGYTGQIAVAAGSPRRGPQEVVFASWGGGTGLRPWGRDDHLIVAQRVTQNATANESLAPMIDEVRQRCGAPPAAALADSGFF